MKRILVILAMAILLVSCGTPQAQKNLETTLQALQKGDISKIKLINPSAQIKDDNKIVNEILLKGFEKMSYKVKNTKVEGDTATVNLDLKVPDLSSYFSEYIQKAFGLAFTADKSDEEMKKLGEEFTIKFFTEKLASEDLKFQEKNINVVLKKEGENWITDNENQSNKEFGEMLTLGFYKFNQAEKK